MIKIILDTDMGPDCDDSGALAIANRLHNNGIIELVGVTHCTSDIGGAYTIAAINSFFSNRDIPVGQTAAKFFLDGDENKKFSEKIKDNFITEHGECRFDDAVTLMRSILADNDSVKLVCIGQLNNLASLLKSSPDNISKLNGIELVKKKTGGIIIMAGDFRGREYPPEYNIKCDVESARYVADNCPVPIVWCGFEIGAEVLTGLALKDKEESNPVRIAYDGFLSAIGQAGSFLRPSLDLVTVTFAAMGTMDLWQLSNAVEVSFDDEGRTITKQNGKDRYLINKKSNKEIAQKLEELLG